MVDLESNKDLYKEFRGTIAQSGAAAAQALRIGYLPLYEVNEYVHDANDADLERIVVQVTGNEAESSVVKAAIASFKALKAFADFTAGPAEEEPEEDILAPSSVNRPPAAAGSLKL